MKILDRIKGVFRRLKEESRVDIEREKRLEQARRFIASGKKK